VTLYRRRPTEVSAVQTEGGDWIVTEGGETRVVTDEEFWRLYEMIDPIGQAVQRFLHPKPLDWSDVK